jgi:hypothetical protein
MGVDNIRRHLQVFVTGSQQFIDTENKLLIDDARVLTYVHIICIYLHTNLRTLACCLGKDSLYCDINVASGDAIG